MIQSKTALSMSILMGIVLLQPRVPAGPGDLIGRFDFDALAPQDITFDGEIYYVTSFLDEKIHRFSADLTTPLEPLETPFDTIGLTAIAHNQNPEEPRLWVAEPFSRELREITLDGQPTGRVLSPDFRSVLGQDSTPVPKSMVFYPGGDGGQGLFYVLDASSSLIFEIRMDGDIVRWFPHPDDPDGFPGKGRGAPSSGIDLILDGDGNLTGFYVSGGRSSIDWIRRLDLDGSYTGFRIPLSNTGGKVSGFLVKEFTNAAGGSFDPAVIALVESKAEMVVIDGTEEPISEILDFTCTALGNTVELTWLSGTFYERTEVYRDCRLLESMAGNPGRAVDGDLGPGVFHYSVRGYVGSDFVESEECAVIIGGGRALRTGEFPGYVPVDLAVDRDGDIYSTDYYDHAVHIHDGETLEYRDSLEIEFLDEKDHLTGIAYSPEINGFLYLYCSEKNIIFETDMGGIPISWIQVQLPNDPDEPRDEPFVTGMTFDSRGGFDQRGLFWIIEARREMIYSVDRNGEILSSFHHPISREHSFPPLSNLFNYIGGISETPGSGFNLLDLTAGSIFERDMTRIIRMDAETGEVVAGIELPLTGLDLIARTSYVAIQHASRFDGSPGLFALVDSGNSSFVAELDATLPDPRPITDLRANLRGREREVVLTFQANDSYERIDVIRDCQLLTELTSPPGAVEFVDRDVPSGLHRYDLQVLKGGLISSPVTAEIRVGKGALLERRFTHPLLSPYQLTRDPVDGSFLLSSSLSTQERSLFRFSPDLTHESTLEDVIPEPWGVATMAIRPDHKGSGLIYVIAWKDPESIGGAQTFPLYILQRDGALVEELEIHPPRPSNGFVTFPTGLCWSDVEDLFYYVERNSNTVVQMDDRGNTLRLIPHPAPPLQSYVYNLGLSVDDENGSIWLTSAGPHDRRITRALQMTPGGRLTGLEIPMGDHPNDLMRGIALSGSDLIVTGYGVASELMRLQSYHPLPSLKELTCRAQGNRVLLAFVPDPGHEQVVVLRNGEEIAVLPGDATEYQDISPGRDRYLVYSVYGQIDGKGGNNLFCEIPPLPDGFIRGDADGSQEVLITDAIVILKYLFLSGPWPACDDAADVDDDGQIVISDVIRLLFHLFLGGENLPPPYPDPGEDPTPDSLTCS